MQKKPILSGSQREEGKENKATQQNKHPTPPGKVFLLCNPGMNVRTQGSSGRGRCTTWEKGQRHRNAFRMVLTALLWFFLLAV